MQEKQSEWITLTEAASRLGVHRNTMRRRVDQWQLSVRQNPRNMRERLINWAEVRAHLDDLNGGEIECDD